MRRRQPGDGDGCSASCKVEDGFTCSSETVQDTEACPSGTGQCLKLPMIYRDFQPENVPSVATRTSRSSGTKFGGSKPTTICVPNSGGPSKGNDSTARCWGIVGEQPAEREAAARPDQDLRLPVQRLEHRQLAPASRAATPRPPTTARCPTATAAYQGGDAGTAVNTTSTGGAYTGTLTGYTASTPGGPIWKGTAPTYKDADSFNQWFNDDRAVNKTFTDVLELQSIGSNIYQYASKSTWHRAGSSRSTRSTPARPPCATCGRTGTTATEARSGRPAPATNTSSRRA